MLESLDGMRMRMRGFGGFQRVRRSRAVKWLACVLAVMGGGRTGAGTLPADWASSRGPHQDGVSTDVDLVAKWSPAGENLVWRADLVGRSTPVVVGGRGCAHRRGRTRAPPPES